MAKVKNEQIDSPLFKGPDYDMACAIVDANLYERTPQSFKKSPAMLGLMQIYWCLRYAARYGADYDQVAADVLDGRTVETAETASQLGSLAAKAVIGLTMHEITKMISFRFRTDSTLQKGFKNNADLCRKGLLRRLPARHPASRKVCTATVSRNAKEATAIFLPSQISDVNFTVWLEEDKLNTQEKDKAAGFRSLFHVRAHQKVARIEPAIQAYENAFMRDLDPLGQFSRLKNLATKNLTPTESAEVINTATVLFFTVTAFLVGENDRAVRVAKYNKHVIEVFEDLLVKKYGQDSKEFELMVV